MSQPTEESYDFLIIGTGLAETAISAVLSKEKDVKILQIDTKSTYGSEFTTLQYTQLIEHFNSLDQSISLNSQSTPLNEDIHLDLLSKNRDFNIDITPKLLLQDSEMKEFLLENEIQDLVNFTSIKGSYLFADKLHSIPTSEAKAMKSSLISFSQKFKVINFFWNVRKYANNKDLQTKENMLEEFKYFGLSTESMNFIGHAIALNLNDEYLLLNPKFTYDKIIKYISSLMSYEDSESPFIYPLYGLSEICQAFARKSALNGTVFMLRAEIKKLTVEDIILKDPNGETLKIKANKIICDPKYWPGSKVNKEIIRCIMIIKNESRESKNIVFLKEQLKRKHDVFCLILGSTEFACPEGYEIGIISTVKETLVPELEIAEILKKFKVLTHFIEIRQLHVNEDFENVYFTQSVDESPVFDGIYDDIKRIIEKVKK